MWAALMPHPPVLVPQVGHGREKEAAQTLGGLERLCAALKSLHENHLPEWLLLFSPHSPSVPGALFVNTAPRLHGNLASFGAPGAHIAAAVPQEAMQELTALLRAAAIPLAHGAQENISQDHAAIVPLYLLSRIFPSGALPPVILANPSGLAPEAALALGKALGDNAWQSRPAFIASGDLSHRLKEDGPYGFNPAGPVFDKAVVAALEAGSAAPLLDLSPDTCENAGECGLLPILSLIGLCNQPVQVLSYEGPFGVGYCTALWTPEQPLNTTTHPYPALARRVIEAHLKGGPMPGVEPDAEDIADAALWAPRHGCFVSIKNRNGSLRGCIGTFMPMQQNISAEIAANAVSAAMRDPRFPPMRPEELDNARISVDVLSEPELVRPGMELDAKIYGVIVTKEGRRGLLLPDLEGVATVEQQLAIAAQKAGIRSLDGAEIYRFTVSRYKEKA